MAVSEHPIEVTSGSLAFFVIGDPPPVVVQRIKDNRPKFELITHEDMTRSGSGVRVAELSDSEIARLSRSDTWIAAGAAAGGGFDVYVLTFAGERLARIKHAWTPEGL